MFWKKHENLFGVHVDFTHYDKYKHISTVHWNIEILIHFYFAIDFKFKR